MPKEDKAEKKTEEQQPEQPGKGNETKGSPIPRKLWEGGMPKTENLDFGKMQEDQQHTLTLLTWNIQGSRQLLYELEEQMQKWDIDVAVVTETKAANADIKRHFRNNTQSYICTSTQETRQGDTGDGHHTAGLAVILRGEYAKPHNHMEVKVPHLKGVLMHTLLHFPGKKYIHPIGVYYPVEGKDATDDAQSKLSPMERAREEMREGIREYIQMVTATSSKKTGETVLVCGDLNAGP
ncbi:hypothetical protein CYMTET_48791 [Cymbomonas tetramitiformis]|uniref:Endonuclease/exonuclease/phosphatase domain-containing protein n=1 Tax=Cymbomonas tetramitiformis TaxID=36881 RepID=A0AAE0BST2_9CHLO|nr:hypothetical protein CYMTET_48791 [Cymbomonas tetramitiformis]